MTHNPESEHEQLLNTVAERYRSDGYEVVIEPEPRSIPIDLGGYRPDLIAKKGDNTAIVEVKREAQRLSFDQLRTLSEEIKRHHGWRFVLVTGQDVLPPSLPEDDQLSWEDVQARMEGALRLAETGSQEAGYVLLWITFERMMRLQARDIALPVDRLAPAILIRQLYSHGELSYAQFETALRCQEVRNRVVHGFRAPELNAALKDLSAVVHELLDEWPAVRSGDQ
jgi:hypothetical protein